MDYRVYRLSPAENFLVWMKALGCVLIIAYLFYRSLWGLLALPAAYTVIRRMEICHRQEKRAEQMQEEFVNGMQTLSTSLQAGLSMENAWREVEKETRSVYGEESNLAQELAVLNQSVAHNQSVEKLVLDLAYRSGVEDMIRFAEVLDYGKRSGGNWEKIIEATVYRMKERYETNKEIQVLIAAKRLEQRLMNVIPLCLLLFLQISSWDYMRVLYHNPLGILCMTLCLCGYAAAIFLSGRIMKIQV